MMCSVMKVTVQDMNYERALYIFSDGNDYGVFELLEFVEFEKGEELIGNFHCLDETTIVRKSDGQKYKIHMEDYGCSLLVAQQIIADEQ